MKILVIGEPPHFDECREKLGSHACTHVTSYAEAEKYLQVNDLIFDFLISEASDAMKIYAERDVTVFVNSWRRSVTSMTRSIDNPFRCTLFGFNGFPTMFNREVLEVALWRVEDKATLNKVCELLGTQYLLVDDRVGLVTPRVVCMIINEAYYTVQEGTATREDIDVAMKLGTNYPLGPFEWCAKIGIKNVYNLLEAVHEDTRDERYKISPLLKKEYLAAQAFPSNHR